MTEILSPTPESWWCTHHTHTVETGGAGGTDGGRWGWGEYEKKDKYRRKELPIVAGHPTTLAPVGEDRTALAYLVSASNSLMGVLLLVLQSPPQDSTTGAGDNLETLSDSPFRSQFQNKSFCGSRESHSAHAMPRSDLTCPCCPVGKKARSTQAG